MADSSVLSPMAMAAAESAASISPLSDPHNSNGNKIMSSSPVSPTHHHNHNASNNNNANNKDNWLDRLSSPVQFLLLASGVFFFFGIHNYLQEAIMNVEGFHFGVMLGYLEVLGVTVCSFFERKFIAKETKRVAPLSAYPLLTFCLMSSSSLSNLALNYINFPTKVVFRSCKLIPTMIVASIVNRKVFSSIEYVCAFCVCLGLVLFAAADWNLTPTFHPIGLVLVSLSVCADAVLPNAQERLFRLGASRMEVTFFTNIFTLIAMTITTLLSGDLLGLLAFAQTNTLLCHYILIYTFVAYIAISVHMNVVRRFGGVAAVLLATGRKGMTLVLSFIFFPKAFSWYYVMGAILVLGGLLVSSLAKVNSKKKQQRQPNHCEDTGPLLAKDNNRNYPSKPFDIEHTDHNHCIDPETPKQASNSGLFSRGHPHQQ
ncbi:UAA transporter family protein [Nitzschia inconspicua]|uniref:UAA transporter family protein n=1 Tax=Nitzschia inconspicua TaxID=303405 RepID=A0A9K3M327_9STRA|nr:UAA transporter family protein [Nitzschia inconspicua]